MKKEYLTSNAKFIYSKNELGYQEILEHFDSTSEITIITYNISEKKNSLFNALKTVSPQCKINVITNIPSRWETYYGNSFRDKARQKINLYLSKLKPEKLSINSSVFFDFSNHGKIIMTDSIVYVGSANYSDESANNTEFGFISEDKDFIEFIHLEVMSEIQDSAIPYYEYDYTPLLLEANVALSAVFNARNELYEEVYRYYDDIDGRQCYYYVEHEATLTVQSLDRAQQITSEACKVASEIYDAIDKITSGDDDIIVANDVYDEICDICSQIEELRICDTIIELSEFNSEEFINQQLHEEYAMEAYEENLENCIESASDEALSRVWDLTQAAKDDLDRLIAEIDNFSKKYTEFIDNLRSRKVKKINPQINNT